jgi:hypothetical protein
MLRSACPPGGVAWRTGARDPCDFHQFAGGRRPRGNRHLQGVETQVGAQMRRSVAGQRPIARNVLDEGEVTEALGGCR